MAITNGSSPNTGTTLAIIGCGVMGTAILSGVIESCANAALAGETPRISRFIATVNSQASAQALRARFSQHSNCLEVVEGGNLRAMEAADIIIWAFKPYMIDKILKRVGMSEALAGKLVISVLVGSPPKRFEAAVYDGSDRSTSAKPFFIVRAMPNIGAKFGQSMTVIEATSLSEFNEEMSNWIFLQVGRISPVVPELFDIAGVLAGATGAFFSVAFDGILDGAVSQGLKRSEAKKILTQSLVSLTTLLENGEHPAVLREEVSSPKGTTIAGLLSLEEDRARYAYSKATIATCKRSLEIGDQK